MHWCEYSIHKSESRPLLAPISVQNSDSIIKIRVLVAVISGMYIPLLATKFFIQDNRHILGNRLQRSEFGPHVENNNLFSSSS